MELINGIVVSLSKYRDNDAIINVLTPNDLVPIIIRGAYSKGSKYLQYAKTFYSGEFETYKGQTKYLKLRAVKIDEDFNLLFSDYKSLMCLELIKELFTKAFSSDSVSNFYLLLKVTLKNIKETHETLKYTLLFVACFLRISGYSVVVNECSSCHKAGKFEYFSFSNGGFICNECKNENDIKLNEQEKCILVSLFTYRYSENAKNIDANDEIYLGLLNILCEFITFYNNIKIISLELLKIH